MRILGIFLGLLLGLVSFSSRAEEALCAEVKIEILQELTMERQGFEALMRITNSLETFSLENVSVKVFFKDADGNPVVATSNTSASNAAFFIRKDNSQDIGGLQEGADGYLHGGTIAPKKVGEMRWLIIPTANAAGQTKDGKLFFVGAELRYSYGGKEEVVTVADDTIIVKPQPELTLDYFLTEEIVGDNGFTPEIEPAEPYTLGVRINNSGFGFAKSVKIESAQPKIEANKLGLAINFKILGSYLKDQPSTPSLLINFGNVEPKSVTTGRWIMESNLAGTFKSFTASYTHADDLGGELTSLLKATTNNFLVRDVQMDLPGRDNYRDFLAYNPSRSLRVFESESTGANEADCANCKKVTEIADATFIPVDNSRSKIEFEPVGGLTYATAADPFNGTKALAKIVRENGSVVHPQNAWLSKKRASDNINFNYFINVFDNNASGKYTVYWGGNLVDVPQPPVIQFVQDQITFEGGNIGFMVRATDPNKTIPTLSVSQLPAGASFIPGAVNDGVFNWSPLPGQAGQYTVIFTATDGELTAERIVNIRVNPSNDTDGDGMDDDWEREKFGNLDKDGTQDSDGDGRTDLEEFEQGTDPNLIDAAPAAPEIQAPVYNADILAGESLPLQPELIVSNGTHAPEVGAVAVLFEVYKDEALTELIASTTLDEGTGATAGTSTTHWKISPVDVEEGMEFEDNTLYYWRARSVQTGENAKAASAWVKSRFFINTANDLPTQPQISSPAIDASIADVSPTLIVTNSTDIDRDELRYAFELFAESDLENPIATVSGLFAGNNGQTAWVVAKILEEDQRYVWQASVTDEHGAVVKSEWGSFIVNTQNHAPTDPQIHSPLAAATVSQLEQDNSVLLRVVNSTDPERKPVQYYFELDKVNTFDSADKKVSAAVDAGTDHTEWKVSGLTDDTHYFWRVKASDGEVESAWVVSNFTVSLANQAPAVPVLQNPVSGALVATTDVVLEGNPVTDPENDIVSYRIQLYSDAALTQQLLDEVVLNPSLQTGAILVDKTTYYWRMRAEDAEGQVSEWSAVETFTINLPVINQKPQFTFIAPSQNVTQSDGTLLIQWQDSDPDSKALIKLLLEPTTPGAAIVIAENIDEDLDGSYDSYLLAINTVTPGVYKLKAEISDEHYTEVVTACCTITVSGTPALPVPHSHWLLNEASGTAIHSQVGSFSGQLSVVDMNPNTAETAPIWVTGRNNSSAIEFDGIGGYLAFGKPITAPLLSESSLSIWVKTLTTVSSGDADSAPAIIGSRVDRGELSNDMKWGSFGLQGQIGLAVGDSRLLGVTKVNDGAWHHVVITRKITPGSGIGRVNVYVDGKLDASGEPRDPQFNGLLNTFLGMAIRNTVFIYPTNTNLLGSGTGFLKATFDDIRVYSQALTKQQVREIYQLESGSLPANDSTYSQFIANGIYQGESASTYKTNIMNNRPGYSGIGFADFAGADGYVEWVVESQYGGPVSLAFQYANGTTGDLPLKLSVNDVVVNAGLSFPKTANWSTWREVSTAVNLQPGKNIIRVQVISGNTDGPHIDFMKVIQ